VTYFLALCAAFFAAGGAALQDREVSDIPEAHARGLRLMVSSLKRPMWWVGMGLLCGAPLFQYLALRVGTLTQVQPMVPTELLFLLGILIVTHHARPRLPEWLGATGIVVGLAMFLFAAQPNGGDNTITQKWALSLSVILILAAGILFLLSRHFHGSGRAALLGSAAAICFAYEAAMTKLIAETPAGELLTSPAWLGLVFGGIFGFLLFQYSLRAGHVAASRAAMVIVDTLASVAIGVFAFHDILNHTPLHLAFECLGFVILLAGAFRLATSPMIVTYDPAPSLAE